MRSRSGQRTCLCGAQRGQDASGGAEGTSGGKGHETERDGTLAGRLRGGAARRGRLSVRVEREQGRIGENWLTCRAAHDEKREFGEFRAARGVRNWTSGDTVLYTERWTVSRARESELGQMAAVSRGSGQSKIRRRCEVRRGGGPGASNETDQSTAAVDVAESTVLHSTVSAVRELLKSAATSPQSFRRWSVSRCHLPAPCPAIQRAQIPASGNCRRISGRPNQNADSRKAVRPRPRHVAPAARRGQSKRACWHFLSFASMPHRGPQFHRRIAPSPTPCVLQCSTVLCCAVGQTPAAGPISRPIRGQAQRNASPPHRAHLASAVIKFIATSACIRRNSLRFALRVRTFEQTAPCPRWCWCHHPPAS